MNNKEDLYEVLGLTKTASDEEIKASYKKLVKKWHPDKNQNNKDEATKKFREISDAYGILSDPLKKKTYDNFGFAGLDENDNIGGDDGSFGMNPFAMFKNFFEQNDDIPEVQVTINLTLEELYVGTKKKVKFNRYTRCDDCNSRGRIGENIDCKHCSGKGVTIRKTPMGPMQNICKPCAGKGVDQKAPKCKKCNGVGCYEESHTLNVTIPKGSSEKHPIIIDNEGNEIPDDERTDQNTRSSVVIIVSETEHPKFNRGTVIKEIGKVNENNLMTEIKLTLHESLCGFERKLSHLDGKQFVFSMNEPVRHNDIFVMKDMGMPYYKEDKKGDLILKLSVERTNVSNDMKQKIWKLFTDEPYVEMKKKTQHLFVLFCCFMK